MPVSTVIVEILKHTPLWVWAILLAITLLGVRQLRTHQLSRTRLLAMPLGLGAYALWSVSAVFGLNAAPAWMAGIALAFAINQGLRWPRSIGVLDDGRFVLEGSVWPLLLMWTLFMLRYALAVKLVFEPALARHMGWAIGAPLLYGTLSGLLAARAWRVLQSAPARPMLQRA